MTFLTHFYYRYKKRTAHEVKNFKLFTKEINLSIKKRQLGLQRCLVEFDWVG